MKNQSNEKIIYSLSLLGSGTVSYIQMDRTVTGLRQADR